jgi:hypothetical protein
MSSIYFLVFREAFSLKAIFENFVRFSCFPRTLHAPPISSSLIFSLQEYLVFFFLTRIRPQWPVTVSLQRLRGLPRDILPFGRQIVIFRELRLWSILCTYCFQLFLYWSMCSSTELIFNSRRISVFLILECLVKATIYGASPYALLSSLPLGYFFPLRSKY